MKKIYTTIAAVLVCALSMAQTTIVEWNFPDNSADAIADAGIAENLDKTIYTEGGTSNIQYKNGFEEKAAQASGWENGAYAKAWVVSFTTNGYGNLQLSSKQTSGGNDPGPRDWVVQYKIGINGEWTDIDNTLIEVQNDWTTGVLEAVELPEEINNNELVFLRWVITSDTNSNGEPLESNGKTKIDNILITGVENTGIAGYNFTNLSIYPNPCNGSFNINSNVATGKIEIVNLSGQIVYQNNTISANTIDVSELQKGIYFVLVWDESNSIHTTQKLIIN